MGGLITELLMFISVPVYKFYSCVCTYCLLSKTFLCSLGKYIPSYLNSDNEHFRQFLVELFYGFTVRG